MLGKTREKIIAGDNYLGISSLRHLPRWMVFLMDILILFISFSISYLILKEIAKMPNLTHVKRSLVIVVGVNIVFMYFLKTFAGIIRHSTFIDIQKIFWSSLFTLAVLFFFKETPFFDSKIKEFLAPLLILYFFISFVLLVIFRIIVKETFHFLSQLKNGIAKKRLLVLGVSETSVSVAGAIQENTNLPFELVGFLTKRHDSKNAKILGKGIILQSELLKKDKKQLDVDGVLIIKETLKKEELNEWVNLFLHKGLEVFQAPTIKDFTEKKIGNKITNLQIEDLLDRDAISIHNEDLINQHRGKNILITGGAGSIGGEIVRQVSKFQPSLVVVLDQAETPLYEIEMEIKNKFPDVNFKFIIGDVSNSYRMEHLFQKYQFSMVYHAAAYKHVPIMENNPHEAIWVNILGTKNMAMLSSKYGVNRFVMISTDKAVNPTNVMGASKRAAELFVQALQNKEGNKTKFITTRFGNVLGSNGSVIPHFKKQIEKGGPITITHPDIVRYFMTISEACELVLQAGTMGKGGEIFVFDMGKPVKILDLAKKMIKLSGYEPDVDIKIEFIGLRPGEKLYEELLSDNTKNLPTPHDKIMVSMDPCMRYEEIENLSNKIIKSALKNDKEEIVKLLKYIVPEFKSNNSVFVKLDK